jgi:patatin-like phospholipase/acyl hydrolase
MLVRREFPYAYFVMIIHRTCRFVVAVDYEAMNKSEAVLFRTYDGPNTKADTCPIYQAARATSAAPTYYLAQTIYGKKYVDGGAGHNNPAQLAKLEAEKLWPGRRIDVIVSIGTGTWRNVSAKDPKRACIRYTTGSHSVHSLMEQLHGSMGNYYRFDVPEMGSEVSLSEWQKITYIEDKTEEYIRRSETQAVMERCALTFDATF